MSKKIEDGLTNVQRYCRRHRTWLKHRQRAFVLRRYTELAEYKTTRGCRLCGEDDARCLDFHHRNPSRKSFYISTSAPGVSRVRRMAELKKCDVVCANCHRKLHRKDYLNA